MRADPMILATTLVLGMPSPAPQSAAPRLPLTRVAAAAEVTPTSPVNRVSVNQLNWRREDGLLIVEVTFDNENEYPVHGVIVTCDFFDLRGLQLGSRGSLIMPILSPGRTTIRGIEFTMLTRNVLVPDMLGGSCRVASAERF